ncbi:MULTISPECIES: DAK2 domain-containing protein [Ruminococcus]|uniref:DAK2 domain fusion protein YloV n=1 Tax=Ruminococcus albus 8 TaxID=246199 RepID=E9SAY4_RUMAL|nr:MULTISPECIES: DAK2 domain-containing protein [Ruminococcus]MBE6872464.1 DAK2 domain-containing protein [Ruminococcus albus]EGC03669.1 DAK2 domain fusion protein YloV [Ruminococcus albus 8]MBO5558620.1 DAK2 domain-containing protein [Ruminococcus sp.]MBQ9542331.1 DAK2 domain-containing protein [Ruminococcus sp.]MBR0528394.1 DAK2 domain-containing protein [Ruminococcus sp.]
MINGNMLRRAFISGAHSITNKKKSVDELNVFPVPDGDTGSNMSMTINNSVAELENLEDSVACSTVASTAASCLLRGARGNSGVILSLIFRGFAKGLAGKNEMSAEDLVNSLELGVQGAYKSVMKPTEGTILTVAREAAEKARASLRSTNDVRAIMADICTQARETLDKTPTLLPALAKAGVVDAGGMGLVIIFEAMRDVFDGGEIVEQTVQAAVQNQHNHVEDAVTTDTFSSVVGQYDAVINFTYCTEMLITKKPDCDDPIKLRAYLETIGDCVVVVDDDEIIKVHVHTNNPGKAIEKGLEFGYINFPKVENMKLQHEKEQKKAKSTFVPAEQEKDFGFVAVAAGNGVEALFKDVGVDCVVKGGQTMNPSTQDILEAIMSCPAKTVFVLPNNKNIIMAAEQAVKLADRKVCVLQTRTIPQGMSAMLAFDPEADFNTNRIEMTAAIERVSTGQITFAARDSDYEGRDIKQGEILAMDNGKLSFVEKDLAKAAFKLTKKLVKGDSSYITIIYGADVTDDAAEALYKQISTKFSGLDVNLINGGQPVYYYIISVE